MKLKTILIAAAVAVAGYLVYRQYKKKQVSQAPGNSQAAAA